jgi:bifunctional UDP-N-acetylglucosamine pyrophosphorylase/glucosamine-1-phosphate N-acetyltransferase
VAPLRIGRGAIVAAGSAITQEVPPDALAFGRAMQVNKEGRAAEIRKAKGSSNRSVSLSRSTFDGSG